MTARAAIQKLLEEDTELLSYGLGEVIAANSVDTPPSDLFIIVKWDLTAMAFKKQGTDRLQIWVHDTDKDYGRITKCLRRIKDVVGDAVHLLGEDGWTLTCAEWQGESSDLPDSGYNTVTRYAEFVTVSRYTPS